ncbi:hypothetical protein C8N36_1142 [Pelagimonas varians]|uniref:Uncharacterized protein n=1 Tax=Pelagimonas varians TaxID=696760 RepID=A0A238KXI7_9RHOB|nr:hypothetical protein C8N36_1142 [Pelagimonas varians]SMX47291.1 hypothetical protein PEV8663_03501 [Pelagimonas varians]
MTQMGTHTSGAPLLTCRAKGNPPSCASILMVALGDTLEQVHAAITGALPALAGYRCVATSSTSSH